MKAEQFGRIPLRLLALSTTAPILEITHNFKGVDMETISAAYAEAHFDQFIDAARRGPVVVTKKNRPVGVFFSIDDIQDAIWAKEAKKAHEDGYLTAEESAVRLNALLHADD